SSMRLDTWSQGMVTCTRHSTGLSSSIRVSMGRPSRGRGHINSGGRTPGSGTLLGHPRLSPARSLSSPLGGPARSSRAGSHGVERGHEVSLDVDPVLDAGREADEPLSNSDLGALLG